MDFTLDSEQTALRDAVRGLLKGYDAEHRREVVAEDPGFDEKHVGQARRDGPARACRSPRTTAAWAPDPVEVSVVAEEIGRVVAPEPFVESVVLAGGLVAAVGSDEQKKEILGGLSAGELVLAFALEPEPRTGGRGVTESTGHAHRRQGAGAQRRRAPTCSSCSPMTVRLFLVEPATARGDVVPHLRRRPRRPGRVRRDARATPLGDGRSTPLRGHRSDVVAAATDRLLPRGARRDGLGAEADDGRTSPPASSSG